MMRPILTELCYKVSVHRENKVFNTQLPRDDNFCTNRTNFFYPCPHVRWTETTCVCRENKVGIVFNTHIPQDSNFYAIATSSRWTETTPVICVRREHKVGVVVYTHSPQDDNFHVKATSSRWAETTSGILVHIQKVHWSICTHCIPLGNHLTDCGQVSV